MSEHLGIKGKIDYYHSALGEEWEFTYCKRCKKSCEKAIIEFHQGIVTNWVQIICGHCKKTIWVASLGGRRKDIIDDKKCAICEKLTNHYDSQCIIGGKQLKYICSKKCEKKSEEIE